MGNQNKVPLHEKAQQRQDKSARCSLYDDLKRFLVAVEKIRKLEALFSLRKSSLVIGTMDSKNRRAHRIAFGLVIFCGIVLAYVDELFA